MCLYIETNGGAIKGDKEGKGIRLTERQHEKSRKLTALIINVECARCKCQMADDINQLLIRFAGSGQFCRMGTAGQECTGYILGFLDSCIEVIKYMDCSTTRWTRLD